MLKTSTAIRIAASLLLLASLLIGIAFAYVQPPWEGFDEPAHYSYFQQIAETGRWPRFGEPISAEVDDYLKVAPTADSLRPIWTYAKFFAAPAEVIAAGRDKVHLPPAESLPWRPGTIPNWQAQHPPLYYLLMAPFYSLAKGWSLAQRLPFLRVISYLMAWVGLCISALLALRSYPVASLVGVAVWPFIFPMWFPAMARIGNDGLVLLIAAIAFPAILRLATSPVKFGAHALAGVVLGLGLLTKLTFLPFAVATGVLLLFRPASSTSWQRLKGVAILAAAAFAVCGWWYVQKLLEVGNLSGMNDLVQLDAAGGLLAGLKEHADILNVVRIPWLLAISFLWGGTWSFVLPPRATVAILGLAAAVILAGCFRDLRKRITSPVVALPLLLLLLLLLFLAALFYQALVLMGLGLTGAGAWYLHSFAPVFAPLLGFAVAFWGRGMACFLLYPLVFLIFAVAVTAMHFAGCGAGSGFLAFGAVLACASETPLLYWRLSTISNPAIAIVLLSCGWLAALAGLLIATRFPSRTAAGSISNPTSPRATI